MEDSYAIDAQNIQNMHRFSINLILNAKMVFFVIMAFIQIYIKLNFLKIRNFYHDFKISPSKL